ncbi:MAG: aminopeptidase N [Myxococcota bacterium]
MGDQKAKYRKDYQPPRHWVDSVDLRFELSPSATLVTSTMEVRRNEGREDGPLELDGENLELRSISVDGELLPPQRYTQTKEQLLVRDPPERFTLQTQVEIAPDANTSLSGLYVSNGNFCTQCEAEGFRRITFFPDRPDVMAKYTTTIVGDAKALPVMLSNGNRVEEGVLDDGRSWVRWEDPFKKPSYLFALVAGNLRAHSGHFTTHSGRQVRLEVWVEPQNIDKCEHALRSLQKSMKWDEEVFGLEYDLDIYMIVAVGDFNMGAMENKGLNVFNSKYVLARPDTANDDDYEGIEAVIAHEYFHNWTGNRVTCRDWFQLTLKEGLTVYRDQRFTADQTSAAVKRIHDVRMLRAAQFEEDAGPMAHPIRPEAYVEMNNFYTATVYIKGAEIVRLYERILGRDGFRKGMDLYFERHDGQAVTCDDFRQAMGDANETDLSQMDAWYRQAGTPRVSVRKEWKDHALHLYLRQSRPSDALPSFEPVPIPVTTALLGPDGPVSFRVEGETLPRERDTEATLMLTQAEQSFVLRGPKLEPIPSLLRNFSAPVHLDEEVGAESLAFRFAKDDDPFNRWEAGQRLFEQVLLRAIKGEDDEPEIDPRFIEAYGEMLDADGIDGSLRALAMQPPSERTLAQKLSDVDPARVHHMRRRVQLALVKAHRRPLEALYEGRSWSTALDGPAVAERRVANTALGLLSVAGTDTDVKRAAIQFERAETMTDTEAALYALTDHEGADRDEALARFHARWKEEPLVVDKWFTVQALSRSANALDRIEQLLEHPDFSLRNPNRVRSLVGAFAAANPLRFHDLSGRGYGILEKTVLELDSLNPQVASRMVSSFNSYRRHEAQRRGLMRQCLERIAEKASSKDVGEIVGKALAGPES